MEEIQGVSTGEDIKKRIIELMKDLDTLGDVDEVLIAIKQYYKMLKVKCKIPEEKPKYTPQKLTNYVVTYKTQTKKGFSQEKTKTFRTLKDVAQDFGVVLGKITYCAYKKAEVNGEKVRILKIDKILANNL